MPKSKWKRKCRQERGRRRGKEAMAYATVIIRGKPPKDSPATV